MPSSAETIPPILAIDTAGAQCSVALADGAAVHVRTEMSARQHAQTLLPMIDQLLAVAGLTLADLGAIAVNIGPGSFTGLRIGVAAAQGLAMGAALPVVPVSSLQALACAALQRHAAHRGAILSLIDARMDEVYNTTFSNESGIPRIMAQERVCAPERVAIPDDIDWSTVLVAGGGDALCERIPGVRRAALVDAELLHSAEQVLVLAQHNFRADKMQAAPDLVPVYIRNQVTG